MFYTNVYDDYIPLKCELKGLHNDQEVVRIANESHPIKLKYRCQKKIEKIISEYMFTSLFVTY